MNEQDPKKYRVILDTVDGGTYTSTPIPGEELDEASPDILDALEDGRGFITLPGEPWGVLVRAATVVALLLEEVAE